MRSCIIDKNIRVIKSYSKYLIYLDWNKEKFIYLNDTVYKICLTQIGKEVIKIDSMIVIFTRGYGKHLELIEMVQRFQKLLDKVLKLILEHEANCKLFKSRSKQKSKRLKSQIFNRKPLVRCRNMI